MKVRSIIIVISFIGLIMALYGCATAPQPQQQAQEEPDCGYPDTPMRKAPGWICDEPVPGIEVSAVGSFRKTKAGVQFQKTQAAAAARNQLAAQMKIHVKQLIKSYTETTGIGDSETVDTVSSDVSKQITSATLVGSKIFRSRTNPETKTMYVLVGLDAEKTKKTAEQAIKTSMNNKKALWQKFLAKQAQDELEAEVAKMTAGD